MFFEQIIKRLKFYGIELFQIQPEYSSFIGNIFYRNLKLPDAILSSIEINRRTFFFIEKFLKQNKSINRIIFPSFCAHKKKISISLEEIGYISERTENWKDLYDKIKTLEIKYRVSLTEAKPPVSVFSLSTKKSLIQIFNY